MERSPESEDQVRVLLRQHAAPRERVVDDHMFIVPEAYVSRNLGSFRLQLFLASGRRPVAVATQTLGEGMSLTNGAEEYAAAVWKQYCSGDAEPPIWIERQILPSGNFDFFRMVTYTCTSQYHLIEPDWFPLTDDELAELVGAVVDRERGVGYVPPRPEPEERKYFRPAWLISFPAPRPFREMCMAGGLPWWRRLRHQLMPRRRGLGCCWYHGGDWHHVCETAIHLVQQAERDRISSDQITAHCMGQPEADRMSRWERQALGSLFADPIHLGERRSRCINGQHRAQAMLDAGVRRTIVIEWEYVR